MGLGPRPPLPQPFTAPAGFWQPPSHLVSSSPAALTSGALFFMPFDVGPMPDAFSALGVGVTTAQVSGTTTTTLAVYPDDGTGGQPRTVGGPIVSGTVTLTATGNRSAAVAWNPDAGRYWLAFLYVATAAPTTAPLVQAITNGTSLWQTTIGGNPTRGLSVAAQTAMPTGAVTLTPVIAGTTPIVAALAA